MKRLLQASPWQLCRYAVHAGLFGVLLAVTSACSNVERSRDVGNPAVSAEVTAKQVCSTCHGMSGNAASPNFPRLAGQRAAYLEEQLKNFRDKHRTDKEGQQYMWGLSSKMNDEQIKGLAEYFSKQVPEPNATAPTPSLVEGRSIFESGIPDKGIPACSSCHGQNGEGIATFPRLAGQHQNYVIKQLKVFKETDGRPGTAMDPIVGKLEPGEISAVAAYVQSLPQSHVVAGSGISVQ